jgi:hypothetical protein
LAPVTQLAGLEIFSFTVLCKSYPNANL